MDPKVTFIVPCYRLAHLLTECVHSILDQTYQDFEILIMDDCSPDNTSEVARSFRDPRVIHIRNESNLGHLRNYNKGIHLARGKYVWIISADDKLRKPYVLQRFVNVMDSHDEVGYVFCSGVTLEEGLETNLIEGCSYGGRDFIVNGRRFVPQILSADGILAPSVMVRKDCYTKVAVFPLDMPHRADIYLWCLFALHYDVAYIAEPMVNYRIHAVSMMQTFMRETPWVVMTDDLQVLRSIKDHARDLGLSKLVTKCSALLGRQYAGYVCASLYERRANRVQMTLKEGERAIEEMVPIPDERQAVHVSFYKTLGDEHRWHHAYELACQSYSKALALRYLEPKLWAKLFLLRLGKITGLIRDFEKPRATPVIGPPAS